jgi:plastocyanin
VVEANTTVTIRFVNDSEELHSLAVYLGEGGAGAAIAGTGEFAPGAAGETSAFLAPGTHAFRCEIHPEMEGVISVE